MYLEKSDVVFENDIFEDNKASISGGCIYSLYSDIMIKNSVFKNSRSYNGGAITISSVGNTTKTLEMRI